MLSHLLIAGQSGSVTCSSYNSLLVQKCLMLSLTKNMVCTYTLLQTKPITARQGEVLRMHPLIENGGIGVRKED
jgi:hypothetical protein